MTDNKIDNKNKSSVSGFFDFKDVDMVVFIPTLIVFLAFVSWGLFYGENMSAVMGGFLSFFAGKLGSIFLVFAFGFFVFALYIAFSKFGNIRIGADDDKPQYPYFTWFAMLFAACYGVGITFWGASEPLTFIATPIFNAEPNSARAAELGLAAAYNHWGPIPWVFPLIAAMALGYYIYRKNMPPRFSLGLYSIFGEKHYGNWLCRLIDGVLVLAAMCGGVTSFGFAINQFGAGLKECFGINITNSTNIICLTIIVAIFTWSCLSGVQKGIAMLSRFNIYLAVIIMVVCFIIGPTLFQMDMTAHAFGIFMDNFFSMNFNTDPISKSGFPQAWTIFYWAYWIAPSAQIGLFIATISRGRTMREMIVGLLVVAPLSTFLWFGVFGGGAIYQQFFGGHDLVSVVLNQGAEYGAWAYLKTLPFFQIVGLFYLILGCIFLITTGDSAVFSWSQASMKRSYNSVTPVKSIRLVYCVIWYLVALVLLMNVGNSMSAIQAAAVSIAAPCLVIFTFYCVAFYKAVAADTPVTRAELNAHAATVGRSEE